MIIRAMEEKDLETVSAICLAAFTQSVADSLSEQGIATFATVADSKSFGKRIHEDNVILVAECDGKVQGVVELKEGRHIAMLFVRPEQQKQGIGTKLLSAVLDQARVKHVTVKASLSSVPAYQKYGFECMGEVGEAAGLVYQPMAFEVN